MDPSQTISAHQPPTQSLDPESGNQEKTPQEAPTTLGDLEAAKIVVTQYLKMLLDEPHNIFSILACVFMWIVLAGFLVLPDSFPKVQKIANGAGELSDVVHFTRNIPSLALAISCCVVGGIGLIWLGLRHSDNYVWLLGSIFIPGMFNGLSGLISTFVNLYGSEDGVRYSATTIGTIVVTGGCTAICGSLAVIYTVLKIIAVRHHERQNADDK